MRAHTKQAGQDAGERGFIRHRRLPPARGAVAVTENSFTARKSLEEDYGHGEGKPAGVALAGTGHTRGRPDCGSMVGLRSSPHATGGQPARLDNGLSTSTNGERIASGRHGDHGTSLTDSPDGGWRGRGGHVASPGTQRLSDHGSTRCAGGANRPARGNGDAGSSHPTPRGHNPAAGRYSTDHRAASARLRPSSGAASTASHSYSTGGRSTETIRHYAANTENRGSSTSVTASGGQNARSIARTAAGRRCATNTGDAADARSAEKTRSYAAATIR